MEHYFGTTEEKHVSVEKAKELKIVEDIVSIKFGKEDRIINVRIP